MYTASIFLYKTILN